MLIFLVGYMGAGKSSVGQLLAQKMGYRFIDTDSWIENRCCKPIPELFEQYGEDYFRTKEKECIEFLVGKDEIVIATGGGLPCSNDLMDLMNELGEVVYLQASIPTLASRLFFEPLVRPLIEDVKSELEMASFIKIHLSERENVYNSSKHKIEVDDLKPVEIADIIRSKAF
jgi:shikimate kinase